MRLFVSGASPFVRKCRIVVREHGMQDRVEEVAVDPYANDAGLLAVNPLAQVPALVDDEGRTWIDSPLICALLDENGPGVRLLPPEGTAHWDVRRRETLADGVLELGVKWLLELRRPESERSPSWIERWRGGIERGLDGLEALGQPAERLDLGVIATGVAVTWLGFRHPSFDWKAGRPGLVALQTALEQRSSFRDTYPR